MRRVRRALTRLFQHPIWPLRDERAAMASPWLYGQDGPDAAWTTSPLGVVNGVLRKVDLVLAIDVDTEDGALLGLSLHRWSAYQREWGG